MMSRLTITQAGERLSLGLSAGLRRDIEQQGVDDWIVGQLKPGAEPVALRNRFAGLSALQLEPARLFERYWLPARQRKDPEARRRYRTQLRQLYFEAAGARVWRALASPWQLRELLVDFWYNHFNVFARKGLCALWTGNYEAQAIRPHVLGRFSDLLIASARHPAMLFYLDNWMNTMPGSRHARGRMQGLNENYARELMELHTVGLHYQQSDVAGATRLLTGWGLQRKVGFRFDPLRHDFGTQKILGRQFAGGESAVEDFLMFLAGHPDTARHISHRMAQYFVADRPPPALIKHMVAQYLASDGDLHRLTGAMIEHPEFVLAAKRRDKFRTPYRYVLALLRAGGHALQNPRPLLGSLQQLGQPVYGCISPDGWASTRDVWLSPDALSARLDFAVAYAGGWLLRRMSEAGDMMTMKDEPVRETRAMRNPTPLALDGVLAAIGELLPGATIATARRAPPRLQSAVLLGSPQMQFC